jgi:hypothetical protein
VLLVGIGEYKKVENYEANVESCSLSTLFPPFFGPTPLTGTKGVIISRVVGMRNESDGGREQKQVANKIKEPQLPRSVVREE